MMKPKKISLSLICVLVTIFLAAPVSAGLNVTDGIKIISPYGNTSPVITVTGSDIPMGSTITISVINTYYLIYSGKFTDDNLVITTDAANATWTGTVSSAGDLVTLTSVGGNTTVGENITVTFTGAGGNPWMPGTADIYGDMYLPLTVTRTDTSETATIKFWIETPSIPPGGLAITDGVKITSPTGATSPEITITDSDIPAGGTITIQVPDLFLFVKSGNFTDANIIVSDTAAAATWSGLVTGQTGLNQITLTSAGGNTTVGETITVTFTGAEGNPWGSDTSSQYGDMTLPLTVTRTDTFQTAFINFNIETIPPLGGLVVTDGNKIISANGTTSPVISIEEADIAQNGTISIDISGLNGYVASGTLTDANIVISDTAAAANWTGTVAGNTLMLTSTGGNTTVGENVTVTFTGAGGVAWIPNTHGNQTVLLTATRTDGLGAGTFNFIIETTPPSGFAVVANFTASPTSDLAPLAVTFNDTSLGSPTSWSWDFGDGNTSTDHNPVHTFYDIGSYTVTLTATNAYGSDTKIQGDYIKVLNGGVWEANTLLDGLTVDNCGSPQTLIVDTSILPAALTPNNSVMVLHPPTDHGFSSITIYALDGFGFMQKGNLIFGNPTGVHLITEEITPISGFSDKIGTNASFNYSVDLSYYPCNAILRTKIWEGVIPEYDIKLRQILDKNNAGVVGTAYTAKVTKINFPQSAPVKLHMSIDSNWNSYPNLPGGPGMIFIWRIADDGNSGQVLPTNYLYNNTIDNLDYYEADSPLGMSTFGLSSLTGNNNPFQVIAFVAAEVVNPGVPAEQSIGGMHSSGGGGGQTTAPPEIKSSNAPDSAKTAKIYSNAHGVITQATSLWSTDGLSNISLGMGVAAKDSSGKPLSSISITQIPAENLSAGSADATLSFTGMAYDLQPDGATFYPSVPLSFTVPQADWEGEYIVQEFDNATGTWQALPGSYNPQTGIIMVQVSHFCSFALFSRPKVMEEMASPTPESILSTKSAVLSNVEMYSWLISIIEQNPVIIVIVLAALVMVAYFGWWKRRL